MSGGIVAAGVLQGVGQTLGAASGPISSGINARVYKKYGLHEPEYLAASQRAAGINPLVAESGALPAPPDLGFSMDVDPSQVITSAQEAKRMSTENEILEQKLAQERNNTDISFNNKQLTSFQNALIHKYAEKSKIADLAMNNAQVQKLIDEHNLLKNEKPESDANAEFWNALNETAKKAGGAGAMAKGGLFLLNLFGGVKDLMKR